MSESKNMRESCPLDCFFCPHGECKPIDLRVLAYLHQWSVEGLDHKRTEYDLAQALAERDQALAVLHEAIVDANEMHEIVASMRRTWMDK